RVYNQGNNDNNLRFEVLSNIFACTMCLINLHINTSSTPMNSPYHFLAPLTSSPASKKSVNLA
ncbi:unnamed protein product, partial [Ceratitis capitata]